ncbi:efflux RND transporter periplasmic adaptor subunit [Sphingorhabdus arenilitoris]|uniref:Efflux RND transporter periplasmic adaptor subunit n=1 Tax=Sphingorhabdus arenilitoris TaxID=1490041 RepID=A0ABV8RF90_9SPHN
MAEESLWTRLRKISFARTILPVLAIIAILIAIYLVATGQPDRTQEGAFETPPKASSAIADAPSVAGAGVVEPSSEVINIGTSLAGLVTNVYVTPGQQVERGAVLFAVDDRAIRARIQEADAAILRARSARSAAHTALATAQQQLALYNGVEDSRAISRAEVIERQGIVRNARAQITQADAEIRSAQALRASAETDLGRLTVRAPIAAEVLSVNIRPGEFVNPGGQPSGSSASYMEIGNTRPMHIRIDIDENEISRVDIGSEAIVSPRGNSAKRVKATFVRAEPLVTPKRSLTNSASERVDVRVLQLIYQLPIDSGFFVGQQVDAFVRAKKDTAKTQPKKQTAAADGR